MLRTATRLLAPTARLVPVLPLVVAAAIGSAWLALVPDGATSPAYINVLRWAFVLVAAAGAFALDDPASAITEPSVVPSPLRAVVRLTVQLAPAVASWCVLLVFATARTPADLPGAALALEQAGLMMLGWMVAAWWRRRTGDVRGGHVAAPLVVLLALAARELPARFVLFAPLPADALWPAAQLRWSALLLCCAVALAVAVRDPWSRIFVRKERS